MALKKSLNILAISAALFFASHQNLFAASPDEIQDKYRSINDLQAGFTQSTYVAILEKNVTESGLFAMKKPGKLRIDYTGTNPKMYISDGKKLWIVDPQLEQVEIHKVSGGSIPKEALEFLKGFGEMDKLFVVESRKVAAPKAGHTYLTLTPKNGSTIYKKLDCEFNRDNVLSTMAIHNKSGNISTYSFDSIKINSGVSDDIFVFKNK